MTFKASGCDVTLLVDMLRTCRPDRSIVEFEFCKTRLWKLGGMKSDKFGNIYRTIGKDPTVCWSSHTDTVHGADGYQLVTVEDDVVKLAKESKSNCLGADDTAGVWLMMEMIKAERPGLYIFHRGEERGTLGSKFIATEIPSVLKGIQACIAFDRRGLTDVITHQRGMRCCSDDFAQSLADQLMPGYKPDPSGIYTDSASYTDIVPECTNVSVGYENEHSSRERLSLLHIADLREKLLDLDISKLVIKRKAGDREARVYGGTYYGGYDDGDGNLWGRGRHHHSHSQSNRNTSVVTEAPGDEFKVTGKNFCPEAYSGYFILAGVYRKCTQSAWEARRKEIEEIIAKKTKSAVKTTTVTTNVVPLEQGRMAKLIFDHSKAVASMLEEWGFDVADLAREISDREKSEGTTTQQ